MTRLPAKSGTATHSLTQGSHGLLAASPGWVNPALGKKALDIQAVDGTTPLKGEA